MDAAQNPDPRRIAQLKIPDGEFPYAFGYIGHSHDITLARLDALLSRPGDKRSILATLKSIRDELAQDATELRCALELRSVKKGGAQ